jgi:hypothetical protein
MKKIEGKLTEQIKSFIGSDDVAVSQGFPVKSFRDLQMHMAQLSCLNKDYILFYRGQKSDYKADSRSKESSFYPTIYRGVLTPDLKEIRWRQLEYASRKLVEYLREEKISSLKLIERKHLLQWSILQHYEVVPTPLIDVTQSLRVACSFALLDNPIGEGEDCAYVYAFALPYVNHRISIDSEDYLTNIRLLSIAPPEALRPYHQEGFLVGEDFIQKEFAVKKELDLNNRLIAKFSIPKNNSFWDIETAIDKSILYPNNDIINEICCKIREEVNRVFTDAEQYNISSFISTSEFMSFISHWAKIETILKSIHFRRMDSKDKWTSIPSVIKDLGLNDDLTRQLLKTCRIRNIVIHDPSAFKPYMASIMRDVEELEHDLKEELKW